MAYFAFYENINWHFTERLGESGGKRGTPARSRFSSDRWATGLIPRGDDFLSQCVSAWERAGVLRDGDNNSLVDSRREKKREGNTGGRVERGEAGEAREGGRKPRFISFQKGSASLASGETFTAPKQPLIKRRERRSSPDFVQPFPLPLSLVSVSFLPLLASSLALRTLEESSLELLDDEIRWNPQSSAGGFPTMTRRIMFVHFLGVNAHGKCMEHARNLHTCFYKSVRCETTGVSIIKAI